MNKLTKFFHELWNPHCEHCLIIEETKQAHVEESARCRSCESYERQIAVLQEQNSNLVNKIINPNPMFQQPQVTEIQPKPLRRGPVPFAVIRQSLESESRAAVAAAKNAAVPDAPKVNESKEIEIKTEQNYESVSELEELVKNAAVSRTAETGTRL